MTLLRDGIKYGAMFGIAREAGKTFNKHEEQKQQQQQQYQPQGQYQQYQQSPPPGQYQQQNRDIPPSYYRDMPQGQYYQQQPPQQHRDANGYLHQAWCNGQCRSQCNGSQSNDGK